MKRIIQGIIIGVVATLVSQYGYNYWQSTKTKDDFVLFEMGKVFVERSLPGAKVLDIVLFPNHKENVDFIYDKMWGVQAKYEKDGKLKKILFPVCKYKNNWISPNNSQMYVLDNKAEIIYVPK